MWTDEPNDDPAVFLKSLLRDDDEAPRNRPAPPVTRRQALPMAKASITPRPSVTTNLGNNVAPPLLRGHDAPAMKRGSRVFVVLTVGEVEAISRLLGQQLQAGSDANAANALAKLRMAAIASATV